MDLIEIRSLKHKRSIFLKVKSSKHHFICKIYPQADDDDTERLACVIKKALEHVEINNEV